MARRNREFRPDKTGTSLLSKLYLTKLQRKTLLRWFLYALVLLVLSVLQDVMFCKLRRIGISVDLLPCAILLICVMLGTETGSVFTLIASAMYLFSGSSPGYYVMALLVLLGVLAATFRQSYLQRGFGAALVCSGGAMLLYELTVFVITLVSGLTRADRLGGFILTGLLSLLLIPVLYPILSGIEKIGGETWRD